MLSRQIPLPWQCPLPGAGEDKRHGLSLHAAKKASQSPRLSSRFLLRDHHVTGTSYASSDDQIPTTLQQNKASSDPIPQRREEFGPFAELEDT